MIESAPDIAAVQHDSALQHDPDVFTFCSRIGASPQLTINSGRTSTPFFLFSKTIFRLARSRFVPKSAPAGTKREQKKRAVSIA
jgi:hypothetical protein